MDFNFLLVCEAEDKWIDFQSYLVLYVTCSALSYTRKKKRKKWWPLIHFIIN